MEISTGIYKETDKGFWPLDFLSEGPDCLPNLQKKRRGGTPGRLLKSGGRPPRPIGKSNIFPKRGTYGPGHMPGAQHIQPNLIFLNFTYLITIIVNLIRALGLRIDYNELYM